MAEIPGSQYGKRENSLSNADSPGGLDNKKRKVASANTSSRGVANLTPEQLAKKRQNDREAQRAIRERTKNQIESLERQIRDLVSQQPYQELQHILRQKENVEAENAEMKKRLASIMGMIEPLLSPQATGGQYPHQQNVPQAQYLTRPSSASNGNDLTPPSMNSPGPSNSQWHMPSTAPMSTMDDGQRNFANDRNFHQQRSNMTHGLKMGPERLGLEFLLDAQQNRHNIAKVASGVNGTPEQSYQVPLGRGGAGPQRNGSSSSLRDYASTLPDDSMSAHTTLPRNGPPTSPLDGILLDFLHDRQQQAADGVATPKLVGPAYPSVSSLLNPAHAANSHPLSKVFTDILGTFPDLSTLPEKVAVLYVMFLIMRWQIAPTQENYDRLPEWVAPRPSQLFTPHPAWIDHLPFPKMRDKLVRDYNPRDYLFDNFFIPFTTTLSLNWPYEPTDTLLTTENEELVINPVFERHLRRLDNWTLGPAFNTAFPGLSGTYRLKVDGDRR